MPANNLQIFDQITISGSINYQYIPANYINGTHVVTNVIDSDYFDILLNKVNLDPTLDNSINGGAGIKIYTPNMFRIRFDYLDTFGSNLGFRDVGNTTSITPYQFTITNDILYDGEDLNSVLQSITNQNIAELNLSIVNIRNALQLSGPTYLLILCDELQNANGTGVVKDFFYKIDLKGKYGEFIYNWYVDMPIFYNEPLQALDTLTLQFVTEDGSFYDFNGVDHSFTLEIVTYNEIPERTALRKY